MVKRSIWNTKQKKKIDELDGWKTINIKYKGHNNNSTNININNIDKSYNTFRSNTGNHGSNVIVTNNSNNSDNHNKINYNQTSDVR